MYIVSALCGYMLSSTTKSFMEQKQPRPTYGNELPSQNVAAYVCI